MCEKCISLLAEGFQSKVAQKLLLSLCIFSRNYTSQKLFAVQEFDCVLLHRLRGWGQPFLAFHPGLLRDTLAYHGCAELFQVSCFSLFLLYWMFLFLCIIAESQSSIFYSQVYVLFKIFLVHKFGKKFIIWTFFYGKNIFMYFICISTSLFRKTKHIPIFILLTLYSCRMFTLNWFNIGGHRWSSEELLMRN